jgi:hypothetical protein
MNKTTCGRWMYLRRTMILPLCHDLANPPFGLMVKVKGLQSEGHRFNPRRCHLLDVRHPVSGCSMFLFQCMFQYNIYIYISSFAKIRSGITFRANIFLYYNRSSQDPRVPILPLNNIYNIYDMYYINNIYLLYLRIIGEIM